MGALGAANLVGVAWLGGILRRMTVMTRQAATLRSLYPFLMGYALFYVAFPLYRYMHLSKRNEQIRQSNMNRKLWSSFVNKTRDVHLKSKVEDVLTYTKARADEGQGPKKIIYTTAVEQDEDLSS